MDDTRSGTPFLSKKFPVVKEVLCIQSRTSPVVYPTRSSLLPGIWICVLGALVLAALIIEPVLA